MRSVTVKRDDLLTKVRANRESHRALFLKAQEGYRARVIEQLDRMLQAARNGDPIRVHVNLDAPEDHTDDYDRIIAMLEMSVDAEIEIDANSFQAYVLDNWSWSRHALLKNSAYASGGTYSTTEQ